MIEEKYRIVGNEHGKYFLMYQCDQIAGFDVLKEWQYFSNIGEWIIFDSIEEAEEYLKNHLKNKIEIVKRFDDAGTVIE